MQVVATNKLEVDRLASLWERAQQNGVPDVQLLKGQNEIAKVEPHCKGLQALWSPHTGVQIWVNWGRESFFFLFNICLIFASNTLQGMVPLPSRGTIE